MKTHKIKTAGYDYYLGGYDGSFTTYCGINEECSEDLSERGLVDENNPCSCKKCNMYYLSKVKKNIN